MGPVLLSTVAVLALTVGPAAAQQDVRDTGGRVYSLVGGGFGDGTFIVAGVGAGLRLTPHLGLDVELAHLSSRGDTRASLFGGGVSVVSTFSTAFSTVGAASEDYPLVGDGHALLFPSIHVEKHGRDVTTFLTKFVVEFPIADDLLFAYLTGGGGVGQVTERTGIAIDPFPLTPLETIQFRGAVVGDAASDGAIHFSDAGFFPRSTAYSEIGLALMLGGGVNVRLWRGLGVGVDLRWLRVLGSYRAFDTAQIAARASYRF